jgi:hypothetical protein
MRRSFWLSVVWLVVSGHQLGCGTTSDLTGAGAGSTGGTYSTAGQAGVGGAGGMAGAGGQAPALPPCPAVAGFLVCETQSWTGDQFRDCVLRLAPTTIRNLSQVEVRIDCVIIPRDPVDGGDGSFWVIDMQTNTITLFGQACAVILDTGAQRADVVAGCSPF